MQRFVAILFVALINPAAQAAEAEWIAESNRHTQVLLEVSARYQPESAANLGLEQYNREIFDLKPKFDERQEADLAAAITKLEAARASSKDDLVKQDLDILIRAAQRRLTTSALNRRLMIPYFDVGEQIFDSFQDMLDARVDKKRYPNALVRLKRYAGTEGGCLLGSRERILERRPATRSLALGRRSAQSDNAPICRWHADLLKKSGLKGWQKGFRHLTRELKVHNDWVRTTVLPRARKTNRLPPEIYADNLKAYGVEADPRDLIQRAMFAYLQTRDELDALARVYATQKGLGSANYRDVIRELKKNRVAGDQVLPVYKSHLAALEDILRQQNIVTLPKRDAVIRLSTEAEAAASPAPHIDPPRLIGNTGEPAEFVLPLKDVHGGEMDDFDSAAIAWTITAHECRPGHELQFAGMLESGSPPRVVYCVQLREHRRLGAVCGSSDEAIPADPGQRRTADAHAARGARLPRSDAESRTHRAGCGEARADRGSDAVRRVREVGGGPLHLRLAGPGDLVLLRLQPPRSVTHAGGNRARSEVQGTAVPRLHHQRRVAAARPAGTGRDDALRAVAEVARARHRRAARVRHEGVRRSSAGGW
jgi:hypothetical protein